MDYSCADTGPGMLRGGDASGVDSTLGSNVSQSAHRPQ